MKNYADRGGCYPPKPDNTLRDLHNSSYHTKAVFNNCFIIHSKYFQSSKNIRKKIVILGFCRVHGKIARFLKTIRIKSKRKMTKKYLETKTLFKEVTNLPLEACTEPTQII